MNKKSISSVSLLGASALLLMSAVQAQRPSPGGTLERARHLFSQIDTDQDGALSAVEAGRTKIPTRDFVNSDTNRDRKLSGDEFLVFYRKLLVKGGKSVGASLNAEVSRIQAARRATGKQTPVVTIPEKIKPVVPTGSSDGKSDAERAQAVRDAATQKRVEAARDQKIAENDARATAARDQLAKEEADRIAAARAQKQADDAARAEAARQALVDEEAARIAAARSQKAQQDAERAAAARRQHERIEKARAQREHEEAFEKHQREAGKGGVGKGPSERAQAFVKRLTASGRLTTQQARDFHAVLLAKASSGSGAAEAKALREALARAKARVGACVRAGHLTSEEGRVLSMALDERAKQALSGSKGDPHGRKPAVGKVPAKGDSDTRGTLEAGRTTKPKSAGVRSVGGKGKARSGAGRGDS
ncbi:MAG: EF-hand domain-containing protein [Planctomycetota bacterium]|nr:EF-hand domain-containing protein [Planctomycetota bacterium]